MFKQKTVQVINVEKKIWEYTPEELRSVLGNFEKEYNENATGEVIHNEILGYVAEGTIEHALRIRAITKKNINGKDVYFVKLPEYGDYNLKLRVLGEVISRRGYASKKDLDRLAETRNEILK